MLFFPVFLTTAVAAATLPGVWSSDLSAAKALADTTDRPLVVMFSNSSGECYWCNRFNNEINASTEWNDFAVAQQLAMAYIDRGGGNWNETYYQNVVSNNTEVTGFPAFVVYGSSGTNVLGAFTFRTNFTFTANGFVTQLSSLLDDYILDEEDLWDPADDAAVGATELRFQPYAQKQYHTMDQSEDTQDWFKFLCARGVKYKLQLPAPADIDYEEISMTNGIISVTNSYPVQIYTNPAGITLAASTNMLGVAVTNSVWVGGGTNEDLSVTNGLPRYIPVTNVFGVMMPVTNIDHYAFDTNYAKVSTNLPYAAIVVTTNGSLSELAEQTSPIVTILDPARESALTFHAGTSGMTNAIPLTRLTNSCVFSSSEYDGAYCFIRVHQENTNITATAWNAFDAEKYQPPRTNLTVVTLITNQTGIAVWRQTVSNEWLSVSYAGPTNIVISYDPYVEKTFVVVYTNRLFAETSFVITNRTVTPIYAVSTNEVVSTGTNHVSYVPTGDIEYKLSYRTWTPGELAFSVTNVQVSETAASVRLSVTRRNGSTGEARCRYRFEDRDNSAKGYEAENGKDYKAAEGTLFWPDGKTFSTNFTVELIQDLHPAWEGDERFAVVLEDTESTDYFRVPIAVSNAVVTLKESARKNAGVIGFEAYTPDGADDPTNFPHAAKPAVTVVEGQDVVLWVGRSGGSNGVVRVKVTTVPGTAVAATDFVPVTTNLVWADGETGRQSVSVQTLSRAGFNRDATFTVKLANEANAAFAAASVVTVTRRDETVAASLDETAAEAAAFGLALRASSGLWFWSGDSMLRSGPVYKGGRAVLQLTLTGPGLLSFGWDVNEGEASDSLVCSGGVMLGKMRAGAGSPSSVLVKPGRQTVTWTFAKNAPTDAASDSYAFLENIKWQPMPKAAAPSPVNNARIACEMLEWELPPTNAVTFGSSFAAVSGDGLPVSSRVVAVSPSDQPREEESPVMFSDLWSASPAVNRQYRWRVDTVYAGGDGTLVNAGPAWVFTYIGQEENFGTLLPLGANGDGLCEALQGVRCDFGNISEPEDGITYALTSGALPPGLSLTKTTGRIAGVPTRAGSWTFLLQATATVDALRVPYDTAQVTVTVYPLGTFAGTYNGWLKSEADSALAYRGSATLSLTAAGKLTARLTADGNAFAFSAAALDEADALPEPGSVTLLRQAGTVVATTLDGKHTNTLDNVVINRDGSLSASAILYTVQKNASTGATSAQEGRYTLTLFRDAWRDAGMAARLEAFKGYYTVALPVIEPLAANVPAGSGYLTLTVAANGAAKLSGTLADGNTWSLASTLLYPDPEAEADKAVVYVYTQPSAYAKNGGLCGKLRITAGGNVSGNLIDSPDGRLQWWNYTPTCMPGATNATPSEAAGFLNAVNACGGYYDSVMNLQTYYLCKPLTFEDDTGYPATANLPADYDGANGVSNYQLVTGDDGKLLPFGTAITVGAQSFSVAAKKLVQDGDTGSAFDGIDYDASVNPSGLKLGLTRATGLLSGSFVLNYERENTDGSYAQRTKTLSCKGVYTPLRSDTLDTPGLGTQGEGFYLLSDKDTYLGASGYTVTYTFSRSFRFALFSEASHDTTWCDGEVTHE